MLGKAKIKFINSLKLKKYRKKYGLFIVEGEKLIFDLINSNLLIDTLIVGDDFNFTNKKLPLDIEVIETTSSNLKKISNLKTPTNIIAIFQIPKFELDFNNLSSELSIFCDDIQNPGNLGTIMRTADWFGIKNIICSENTVDIFNSKTVQATMGALARVNVTYVNSLDFFEEISENDINIYGTLLEGENIFTAELSKNGIIIVGNEGKGISEKLMKYINRKLLIPNYPENNNLPESLNASIATAIVCSEFRRRLF